MIKISVIVPVYNISKYLDKCLDSLVNQTFKDYELIIINDGSTDDSNDIIMKYKNKFPDLIVNYSFNNQGISKSRNIGLSKARGEYISFVDGDDYVDQTFLEKMYNKIIDSNSDICVCDYYTVNERDEVREFLLNDFYDSSFKTNPKLLIDINTSPWNKLYKKSLFKNYKFEDIKYEDLLLITKLICISKKITKLNECLNYYRIREYSETTVMDRRVFDILKILDNLNDFFKEKKLFNKNYEIIEYLNIYRITMYCLQQKNQINKDIKNEFIDCGFNFLNSTFPSWRKNKYYKMYKNIFKRIIMNSKFITKLYVK